MWVERKVYWDFKQSILSLWGKEQGFGGKASGFYDIQQGEDPCN